MRKSMFLYAAVLSLAMSSVQAAQLKPYQQTALEQILATVPADQREMLRPSLEMTLANLSEAHVAMMLAQYHAQPDASAELEAEETPANDNVGEWGPAEADFEKSFPQIQAYMDRVSNRHDVMRKRWEAIPARLEDEWHRRNEHGGFAETSPIEVCATEMNLVPRQRRESAFMREVMTDQDRISTRTLIELRAQYPTLRAYARATGMSEQSEYVQGMRHHFARPLGEAAVMATLASVDERIAVLIEKASLERHRIDMTSYADSQMGSGSPMRDRDLQAHEQRVRKEAAAVCSEGLAAYMAGLVGVVEPIVPKVKAQMD